MPSNASAVGQPDERALEVVGPGVERAGEAPGLAGAVDHPDAAVAADVRHRLHLPVAVARDAGRACRTGRRCGSCPARAARRRGRGRAAGRGRGPRARRRGARARCRCRRAPRRRRRRGRWCRVSMWSSNRRTRLCSSASRSIADSSANGALRATRTLTLFCKLVSGPSPRYHRRTAFAASRASISSAEKPSSVSTRRCARRCRAASSGGAADRRRARSAAAGRSARSGPSRRSRRPTTRPSWRLTGSSRMPRRNAVAVDVGSIALGEQLRRAAGAPTHSAAGAVANACSSTRLGRRGRSASSAPPRSGAYVAGSAPASGSARSRAHDCSGRARTRASHSPSPHS